MSNLQPSSTSSPKTIRRRSSSSGHPRSPQARPRPIPPENPPDPPLTLLHPITSIPSRHPPSSAPVIDDLEDIENGVTTRTNGSTSPRTRERWYVRVVKGIGSGMRNNVRARIPYYISDWTDAWNYRVIPSTLFIFFANVFPGIAFSLDLIETTGQYGVQEVLLSTFMAAFIAGFFGGQPLLVSGVTGPITVFNKTIFDIFESRADKPNYLYFMGWTYLWGAIFHWIAALFNAVKGLKYVTRFSCDTFGFYVAAVYVQYGIQVVERQFQQSTITAGFLGIILAVLTLILPHYFNGLARSGYVSNGFRRFCSDYGMPITMIAVSGLAYWGRFNRLPVVEANFQPANNREWLVRFWQLEAKWVGTSLPFGFILFILFYFDSNVSSLIAQGSEFPLRKPPGFHWDFFLLGITTFIAGLLGVPAPNGLIPQAPLHTASLVIMGYEDDGEDDHTAVSSSRASGTGVSEGNELQPRGNGAVGSERISSHPDTGLSKTLSAPVPGRSMDGKEDGTGNTLRRRISVSPEEKKKLNEMREANARRRQVPVAVVEQRVSNLAQGTLCLVLMTKPFEHVLGLIPKGVLAGLFWYMGTEALLTSGVTEKMLYLIKDRRAISPSEPLNQVRKSRIILFTLIELLGFGATFAITQTIAAIGFPIIIMLLVPLRVWVVPRLPFTKEELDILDGPVASDFTLESVGGSM